MQSEQEVKEKRTFDESLRLIHLERSGADLIDAGLDGRAKTVENVVKLWKMVKIAYSASISIGLCKSSDAYWREVAAFLLTEDWTEKQLKELYDGAKQRPVGEPSIFDGLED